MPNLPQLSQLDLKTPDFGQTEFNKQAAGLDLVSGLLTKAKNLDNAAYQTGVFDTDPNLKGNVASLDEMARLYSLGAVDDETKASIQRQNAFNALQGGYASGGTPQGMEEAQRNVLIGREALNRQQQAPGLTRQAEEASLALNPTHIDVGSTLISPAALLARQDSLDYSNNNLKNNEILTNAGAKAAGSASAQSGAASGIGGLLGGSGGLSGLFSGGGAAGAAGGAGEAAGAAAAFI